MFYLAVHSCHVMQGFQSESTLYSCLSAKDLLLGGRCEICSLSYYNCTRTQNHMVPNWPNDWAEFWELACTLHLAVSSCHVAYPFQSESKVYSCQYVKELLVRSRREIWNLSRFNWTRTESHLLRKRTLNHLAKLTKWPGCVLSTYLYAVFYCILLSCHIRVSEWV